MDIETFQALLIEKTNGHLVPDSLRRTPGGILLEGSERLTDLAREITTRVHESMGFDSKFAEADYLLQVPGSKSEREMWSVVGSIFDGLEDAYEGEELFIATTRWKNPYESHGICLTKDVFSPHETSSFRITHSAEFHSPLPQYAELFKYVRDGGSSGLEPAAKQVYDLFASVEDPRVADVLHEGFNIGIRFYLANPDKIDQDFEVGLGGNSQSIAKVAPYLKGLQEALQKSARAIMSCMAETNDSEYQFHKNTEIICGAVVMGKGGDLEGYTNAVRPSMRTLRSQEN